MYSNVCITIALRILVLQFNQNSKQYMYINSYLGRKSAVLVRIGG